MDDAARPSEEDDDALDLERFLPYRLAVLAHTVSGALSTIYRDRFDLTIPEWRVMANLGREEPSSSNRLAERGSMDKAKVSRAVARLTKAGLITRETDPRDNRLIVLKLSARGREVYERIAPLALAWEADLLAALGADERAALDSALAKLQRRAQALKRKAER